MQAPLLFLLAPFTKAWNICRNCLSKYTQGLLTIYSQANLNLPALARAVWGDPEAAPSPAHCPGLPGFLTGASQGLLPCQCCYLTYSQELFLLSSKATPNQSWGDERKADTEAWLEVEVIRMLETKSKQKIQLLRSPPLLISGSERDKNVSIPMMIFEEKNSVFGTRSKGNSQSGELSSTYIYSYFLSYARYNYLQCMFPCTTQKSGISLNLKGGLETP